MRPFRAAAIRPAYARGWQAIGTQGGTFIDTREDAMQRILARLLTPPLLWAVLAISGVALVGIGLLWLSPALCLTMLGMMLLAYAAHSARLAQARQQEQRPPRRREGRIEYLSGADDLGCDVIAELPDRGRLLDAADDDESAEWSVSERYINDE
jgi:hypothetical protein